jgi:hypothetical protein
MKPACMPGASRKDVSNTALFVVAMNEILLMISSLLCAWDSKKHLEVRFTNQM